MIQSKLTLIILSSKELLEVLIDFINRLKNQIIKIRIEFKIVLTLSQLRHPCPQISKVSSTSFYHPRKYWYTGTIRRWIFAPKCSSTKFPQDRWQRDGKGSLWISSCPRSSRTRSSPSFWFSLVFFEQFCRKSSHPARPCNCSNIE